METKEPTKEAIIKDTVAKYAANQPEDVKKALEKVAHEIFEKGVLPKDAIGLSDEMMEGFYAHAYRLYNNGKYKEATQLFRLLIMMDATEPKYALGLAACYHMLKDYSNAAVAYAFCGILDPESPIPHYHASDCHLQKGDKVSALAALEESVKRAGDRPEYAQLKDRARLTMDALKSTGVEQKS